MAKDRWRPSDTYQPTIDRKLADIRDLFGKSGIRAGLEVAQGAIAGAKLEQAVGQCSRGIISNPRLWLSGPWYPSEKGVRVPEVGAVGTLNTRVTLFVEGDAKSVDQYGGTIFKIIRGVGTYYDWEEGEEPMQSSLTVSTMAPDEPIFIPGVEVWSPNPDYRTSQILDIVAKSALVPPHTMAAFRSALAGKSVHI